MCKDTENQDIEWFSMFKIPKISDSIPNHEAGLGFFYHDKNNRLHESPSHLNSSDNNPMYNTLQYLYSGNQNIGYLLFSDQPPNDTASSSYAHMKGVVIFDTKKALVIEHSVPNFPESPKTSIYSFPDSGVKYGQSFLCMSFELSSLDSVIKGLLISRPYVYDYYLPQFATTSVPSIQQLISRNWNNVDETASFNIASGDDNFSLFVKSKEWNFDIYHDLVAPSLKSNLIVETWCLGPSSNNMPSNCSNYHVYNAKTLNFDGVIWTRTKDHSKYAIGGRHICISGTNRQLSQTKRGGGAFCIEDQSLSKTLLNIFDEIHYCE